MMFSEEQKERYARHLILDGVGVRGQERLLSSKVLVIGAGGLGSPALLYLAASGVGTIGIVDGDTVDLTNLQRQVIHGTPDLGVRKVKSAAASIKRMNPDVKTNLYDGRIGVDNIFDIIEGYDFILDAVDSFAAKFLINDACVLAGKPFCHAGALGFGGQIMTYVPGDGPCFRCVFEEIPPEGDADTCAKAGVLGTVPGILGSLQALEAQKYLLGLTGLLTSKILMFDGKTAGFRTVQIEKRSESCRVCGKNPDIKKLCKDNYVALPHR